MLDSTSRGSYTFGNSLCIGGSPFRYFGKRGNKKIAPFCHSKTGRTNCPWYHLYSGYFPHSCGAVTPRPANGGQPLRPTSRSAESSGTTWAGLHGRLHRPRPLSASVDRLLLPIIAVQYCRQYTISRAGCQLYFRRKRGLTTAVLSAIF